MNVAKLPVTLDLAGCINDNGKELYPRVMESGNEIFRAKDVHGATEFKYPSGALTNYASVKGPHDDHSNGWILSEGEDWKELNISKLMGPRSS